MGKGDSRPVLSEVKEESVFPFASPGVSDLLPEKNVPPIATGPSARPYHEWLMDQTWPCFRATPVDHQIQIHAY
jgi:hypothetical protein